MDIGPLFGFVNQSTDSQIEVDELSCVYNAWFIWNLKYINTVLTFTVLTVILNIDKISIYLSTFKYCKNCNIKLKTKNDYDFIF